MMKKNKESFLHLELSVVDCMYPQMTLTAKLEAPMNYVLKTGFPNIHYIRQRSLVRLHKRPPQLCLRPQRITFLKKLDIRFHTVIFVSEQWLATQRAFTAKL